MLLILDAQHNDGLIFFSDEATFHVSGMVYNHTCRIWDRDDSFATMQVEMNSPTVNVWCAMSSKMIVGPFFFDELTVDQHSYLDMLQSFFYPFLQRNRLTGKIISQQDEASIHFAKAVRSWLNEKDGDR